jgi:hypothetical protein
MITTTYALAEQRTFIDKEVFIYSRDGKTSREKPFRELTFSTQSDKIKVGDKIYVSGKITKDTPAYKSGETFKWASPFTVTSLSSTFPQQSLLYQWFQVGKYKEAESVIHASRTESGGPGGEPELLILGKYFYMMVRFSSLTDGVLIIKGERVDN